MAARGLFIAIVLSLLFWVVIAGIVLAVRARAAEPCRGGASSIYVDANGKVDGPHTSGCVK